MNKVIHLISLHIYNNQSEWDNGNDTISILEPDRALLNKLEFEFHCHQETLIAIVKLKHFTLKSSNDAFDQIFRLDVKIM